MPPKQLPDRQPAACLSRLICSNSSALDRPTFDLRADDTAHPPAQQPAIQVRDQGSGLPALSA
jgi:hypothetical protein